MNKEELQRLYIDEDLSQRDVAKKLDCSQGTIRYFLKKYAIEKLKAADYVDLGFKSCSKCQQQKALDKFYKRSDTNTYSGWCRDCMNAQTVERLQKHKALAVAYKGGECQNCSFKEYFGALEFHHLDPNEKDFDFTRLKRDFNLVPELKLELDKCVLLCANCHRMTHAGLTKFSKKEWVA